MSDLVIAGISFTLGLATAMIMFRWGANWAVRLVYKIKEDIPLEGMGEPIEQDFSGTE